MNGHAFKLVKMCLYCLFIVFSDKMMFHIGTKNIVGDNIKILQLSPI